MRKAFLVVAALMAADVIAQLYLAGVGAFNVGGRGDGLEDGFAVHAMNGRVVMPALALALILFAALARAGRATIWLAIVILLFVAFVQAFAILIPLMLTGSTIDRMSVGAVWAAAVHPITGLALIAISIVVLVRAYRLVRRGRLREVARPTQAARAS
ncbi:DUF6220 domain-containing protein [Sinomonas sp. B1-1]|uniref:DUF6220 domain-containing protein n=1 Tax=Sinomonas sp. B1-1 TaxID=3141454 RepID=UPI003D2E1D16